MKLGLVDEVRFYLLLAFQEIFLLFFFFFPQDK